MYGVFGEMIIDRLNVNGMPGSMRRLSRAILSDDLESMEACLKDLL